MRENASNEICWGNVFYAVGRVSCHINYLWVWKNCVYVACEFHILMREILWLKYSMCILSALCEHIPGIRISLCGFMLHIFCEIISDMGSFMLKCDFMHSRQCRKHKINTMLMLMSWMERKKFCNVCGWYTERIFLKIFIFLNKIWN
jgi:hypothetical protein